MPLESSIQNFNIVLRNEDFNTAIQIGASGSTYYLMRVGKWLEVRPTILLTPQRDLFIDETNKIYNIENINQALRLFIRPISFSAANKETGGYGSSHLSCDSDIKSSSSTFIGSDRFMKTILSNIAKTPKEQAIYYSLDSNAYSYTMICFDFDALKKVIKDELGDFPADSIVNSFYLNGKFAKNQPHIEHINSGEYSIYNNLRLISLAKSQRINTINYDNLSCGFISDSIYSNPTYNRVTGEWAWDYMQFKLDIKYISDIVDLANAYLSYGIPYSRYIVFALTGDYGYESSTGGTVKKTYYPYAYSCFEFFLAPVGEAS